MNITIDCPHGGYDEEMRIVCDVDGQFCGYQYLLVCKGWCTLTKGAKECVNRNGTARAEGNKDEL